MRSAGGSHFAVKEISPVGQGWLKAALLRAGYVLARIRPWLALPSLRVRRTPTPIHQGDPMQQAISSSRPDVVELVVDRRRRLSVTGSRMTYSRLIGALFLSGFL